MTDKYDDRVGHLNDPIFKSSDALALSKGDGGWMLKFRVDWRARAPNNEAMGLRAPRKKMLRLPGSGHQLIRDPESGWT